MMARNKYRAIRTPCSCGVTHDSKMEAAYCQELQVRVKAGDIWDFEPHPDVLILVPKRGGCKAKAIAWKLDFFVMPYRPERMGDSSYYVDVKGRRDRETQMKIRLWRLMGIPWELRIVYPDRVEVYNKGGEA